MKVSIVLSTYNGEKYIVEQLNSLKNQDCFVDEVLIADDCSSDKTVKLVENFIEVNSLKRWRFIINEKNKGWRQSFMDLIDIASGDIIFTCDQDDIWSGNKIRVMSEVMKENNNIELLVSKYTEFFEDGREIVKPQRRLPKEVSSIKISKNILAVPYPGCTYCIRKSLADRAKNYWESDFPHDAVLWRMAMFSGTLYVINESLIHMRKHSESTFTRERKNLDSNNVRYKALEYEKRIFLGMNKYLNKEKIDNNLIDKKIIINRAILWNSLRTKFYETKNPFLGITLIRYIGFYPTYKRYFMDWLYFFGR